MERACVNLPAFLGKWPTTPRWWWSTITADNFFFIPPILHNCTKCSANKRTWFARLYMYIIKANPYQNLGSNFTPSHSVIIASKVLNFWSMGQAATVGFETELLMLVKRKVRGVSIISIRCFDIDCLTGSIKRRLESVRGQEQICSASKGMASDTKERHWPYCHPIEEHDRVAYCWGGICRRRRRRDFTGSGAPSWLLVTLYPYAECEWTLMISIYCVCWYGKWEGFFTICTRRKL